MLPITHVTGQQSLLTGGIGSANKPETGEFNFFDYLLGLQVGKLNPKEGTESDALAPVVAELTQSKETESRDSKEEVLLNLFDQGQSPLLSQALTPGAMPPWQTLQKANLGERSESQLEDPKAQTETLASESNPLESMALSFQSTEASHVGLRQNTQQAVSDRPEENLGGDEKVDVSIQNTLPVALRRYASSSGESQSIRIEASRHAFGEGEEESAVRDFSMGESKELSLEPAKGSGQLSTSALADFAIDAPKAMESIETEGFNPSIERTSVPELFEKVETLVHRGGGKMTVSLNPPHLGEMEIEVTARGKEVEIQMISQSDMAKSILEDGFGELKQSLQVQDLTVSKLEVQVGRESDSSTGEREQPFSELSQENQQQKDSQGNQERSSELPWNQARTSAFTRSVGSEFVSRPAGNSGVDIRI